MAALKFDYSPREGFCGFNVTVRTPGCTSQSTTRIEQRYAMLQQSVTNGSSGGILLQPRTVETHVTDHREYLDSYGLRGRRMTTRSGRRYKDFLMQHNGETHELGAGE